MQRQLLANTWEELNFDFTGFTDQEYSKVVIFFDFGNAGTGTTFYFDDIEQSDGDRRWRWNFTSYRL